jgi:hypothetical protein
MGSEKSHKGIRYPSRAREELDISPEYEAVMITAFRVVYIADSATS